MNPESGETRITNPFSTRFVRPGAIDYLYQPGQSALELVSALAQSGWRGQIVGPHGSGKSTLLTALANPLRAAGRPCSRIVLHEGQRWLPANWLAAAQNDGARLIVVDGYEQLNAWSRLRLKLICRRRDWGLLVTAHRDVGFPLLLATQPSLEIARDVVRVLLSEADTAIGPQQIAESFALSGGNVREMLFALYDEYERSAAAVEQRGRAN